MRDCMGLTQRRQIILGMMLAGMGLGALLFVSGLSSTLQLGDANIRGFLLLPSLPTSLYHIMVFVVIVGVGLTLLASFVERHRNPGQPNTNRQRRPIKPLWQVFLSLIISSALLLLCAVMLMRQGGYLIEWFEDFRHQVAAAPGVLAEGTKSLIRRVDSPMTGYTLFFTILIVYGGLASLALWVMCGRYIRHPSGSKRENPHTRQVRRAFSAGLRELQLHTDPRQAIIACYARLEHLLEDHGVPVYRHLTPKEYMGTVLQGIDLPMDAFADLVALFEQARYSLHPLDDAARENAATHLNTLKTHLKGETVLETHV